MNVGIVVCSYTGNTLSVAQRLERELKAAGHNAEIARVEPVNDNPNASGPVELKSAPDVSRYDVVVFASPVHAFSLAPLMKKYLSQVSGLSGKKVYCFVTQHLKRKWMGGNRAVGQIGFLCREKGAEVIDSSVVNWSNTMREKQIEEIVSRFSAIH